MMTSDALKKSIEDALGIDSINISFKRNPLNSDGSFIFFEDKFGPFEKLQSKLLQLDWIDYVSLENQYINLWLTKVPLACKCQGIDRSEIKIPLRLIQLRKRLKDELKSGQSLIPSEWMKLIKVYNLCVIETSVFHELSEDWISSLLDTFRACDLGYVYRRESEDKLRGILSILDACLHFLERICHE